MSRRSRSGPGARPNAVSREHVEALVCVIGVVGPGVVLEDVQRIRPDLAVAAPVESAEIPHGDRRIATAQDAVRSPLHQPAQHRELVAPTFEDELGWRAVETDHQSPRRHSAMLRAHEAIRLNLGERSLQIADVR
jgi:hypothetical protein